MNAQRADDYSALDEQQRNLVSLARQANADTWNGGCSATIRADALGYGEEVVSEVYSRSSGKVPDHLDAFECKECGCVHYGREAAEECCQVDDSDEMDPYYQPGLEGELEALADEMKGDEELTPEEDEDEDEHYDQRGQKSEDDERYEASLRWADEKYHAMEADGY